MNRCILGEINEKTYILAKSPKVHKGGGSTPQPIGGYSFASDKKSPKLCHRESSSRVLIWPQELTFRILTGKQHYHHFQKFGTIQKETYTEATKTKTSSFGEQD